MCWLEKHWLILCVLELWLGDGSVMASPPRPAAAGEPRLSVVPETLASCRAFCPDGSYPHGSVLVGAGVSRSYLACAGVQNHALQGQR